MAALNIPGMEAGASRAIAYAVEGSWSEFLRDAAVNVATASTWAQEMTDQELAEIFGVEMLGNVQAWLQDLRDMWNAASALDNGTAVLVPWKAEGSDVINVAVLRRDSLPAGTELGVWQIVLALTAAAITTGVVLYQHWQAQIVEMRERTATLRLQLMQRAQDRAMQLQQSNPQLAAKMLDTAAKASAVEVTAAQNPKSWLDSFFSGVGQGAGSGIGIAAVLAALWMFASRRRAA